MSDTYGLTRFLAAQERVYDNAIALLRGGRMFAPYFDFIFPRIVGVYEDARSTGFALSGLDEARAYLAFPILGNRYRESVAALDWLADRSVTDVFGQADARRLHASLTLFAEAASEPTLRDMLTIWFDNLADEPTMAILERDPNR